jgi:hypothetical protein
VNSHPAGDNTNQDAHTNIDRWHQPVQEEANGAPQPYQEELDEKVDTKDPEQ